MGSGRRKLARSVPDAFRAADVQGKKSRLPALRLDRFGSLVSRPFVPGSEDDVELPL